MISLCALLVVSLAGYFVLSAINRAQKDAEIGKIKVFSENFIRDYSTYKVSSPEEYNTRISSYISDSYKQTFLDKYQLGPIKSLEKADLNNYSKYESSEIDISQTDDANIYSVTITYVTDILDASWSSTSITETNKIEISVVKNNGSYYITTFAFIDN